MNNYRNEIRKRTIRTAPQVGKHHGEGPSDGAQRNARIAADVAARKAEREDEKEKKIADRTAAAEKRRKETLAMATEENLDEVRLLKPTKMFNRTELNAALKKHNEDMKRLRAEISAAKKEKAKAAKAKPVAEEETGTEARTKIKNVSRPDDAEPTSKDSKLAKTGEIKTKKIDEGRSMSINRNFGLPESLIAATRSLLEKKDEDDIKSVGVGKGKTAVDTKPETDDTVNDGDDAPDKKKGKKKLDPVGKEDDDVDNDGDVDNSDKYLKNRRKAISKAMKEDVEQIDELKKSTLASYINKASDDATKHSYIAGKTGNVDTASKASQRIRGIATAAQKLAGKTAAPAPAPAKKPMKNPAAAGAAAAKADDTERTKLKAAGKKVPASLTGKKKIKEEVEQFDEAHDMAHFISKSGNNTYHFRVSNKGYSLSNQHGISEHPSAVIDTKFQGYHKAEEHAHDVMNAFKHGGKDAALKHLNSVTYGHKKFEHASVKEDVEQVDEVLSKKAPAGEWIKDFQKSDNPKFAGKSAEKRKQMALAAYYAKQRNEEVEEVDEAKLSPEDFMKGARRAGTGTDDQLKASASKKNAGPGSGKIRQLSKDELKRRGVKEEVEQVDEARSKEGYQTWPGQKKKSFFSNKAMDDETRKWKERKDAERAEREKTSMKKEEVEQIDEISKKKMWSYSMDAKGEIERDRARAGKPDWDYTHDKLTPDQVKRHTKRMKGLSYAAHKLSDTPVPDGKKIFSKEEFSADEIARLEEIAKQFD